MSTNDLAHLAGTAASRARGEWMPSSIGRNRRSPVKWRKHETGAGWADRTVIRRAESTVAEPVSVLKRLNDELEQLHLRQLNDEEDGQVESEIERLEHLAATLLHARANISIGRVSSAIDSAVAQAERLLGKKR